MQHEKKKKGEKKITNPLLKKIINNQAQYLPTTKKICTWGPGGHPKKRGTLLCVVGQKTKKSDLFGEHIKHKVPRKGAPRQALQ